MVLWPLSPVGPCFGEETVSLKFAWAIGLPGVVSRAFPGCSQGVPSLSGWTLPCSWELGCIRGAPGVRTCPAGGWNSHKGADEPRPGETRLHL